MTRDEHETAPRPAQRGAADPRRPAGADPGPRSDRATMRNVVTAEGRGPQGASASTPGGADAAGERPDVSAAAIAAELRLPTPTEEQREVIEAPPASMLIVAGAGSGKTETMTSRVVWLVANGYLRPAEVLGLTFTRKAAGELALRIGRRLTGLAASGLWTPEPAEADERPVVSTYHAYAGRLVAEHGVRVGLEPDARLLGQAAAWQLAHESVLRYDGPMEGVEAAESTVTAAVVDLAGEVAEHLVGVRDVAAYLREVVAAIDALPAGRSRAKGLPAGVKALRRHAVDQGLVLPIVEAFAAAKRRRDSLDFADQVAWAARLAEGFPAVAAAERRRYAAVLLDEFQDTSEAQLRLLRALFVAPGAGAPVPVTAVGDPHQSIYGWRGAGAGTLARFPTMFAAPASRPPAGATAAGPGTGADATDEGEGLWAGANGPAGRPAASRPSEIPTLPLSTSWRNDERILAAANAAAEPLRAQSRVAVASLAARPGADVGHVSAARYETEEIEAAAVAEWVADRLGAGEFAPVPVAQDGSEGPAVGAGEGPIPAAATDGRPTPAGSAGARPRSGRGGPGAAAGRATPDAGPDSSAPTGEEAGSSSEPPPSVAVLCRRRAQFPLVVDALRARGLPVEVVGLGGLLTTPEVVDITTVLGVVDDPGRADLLMRALTGPRFGLGPADLDAFGAWSRELRRRRAAGAEREARDGEAATGARGEPAAIPGGAAPDGPGRARGADVGTGISGRAAATADAGRVGPVAPAEASVRREGDAGASTAEPPPGAAAKAAPADPDDVGLVDALEELPPASWRGPDGRHLSDEGRRRLRDLRAVVGGLRGLGHLPPADLVVEAERALGVDVELMARPDVPPEAARVHVDALAEVAAEFAASVPRPTLGGFLGWLEVAQDQERGLDLPVTGVCGRAVQVLTVHAAKGLEWDHVAIPGLVEGAFPSYGGGRTTVREGAWYTAPPSDRGWLTGLGSLPYDLRGDAAELPRLDVGACADLAELEGAIGAFAAAGGERALQEERRLAYVALTRARHTLHLSAHVWGSPTTPRLTSRFLTELVDGEAFVEVGEWAPLPPTDGSAQRPASSRADEAVWPGPAPAESDLVLAAGADAVRAALARRADASGASPHEADPTPPPDEEAARLDRRIAALLAERDRPAAGRGAGEVVDAGHLTTSDVVALARDRDRFIADLRRPVPQAPSAQVRAGTLFHAWIEEYYRTPAALDLDGLDAAGGSLTSIAPLAAGADAGVPGGAPAVEPLGVGPRAATSPGTGEWETAGGGAESAADAAPDADGLERMRAAFLASPWASRAPLELEASVETVVEGVPVRGRLDAVFADPDGGVVIVDWKTGTPPTGDEARARSWQLGLYRLAYRRRHGLPPEKVRAVFFYAANGTTVAPPLPSDDELVAALRELLDPSSVVAEPPPDGVAAQDDPAATGGESSPSDGVDQVRPAR